MLMRMHNWFWTCILVYLNCKLTVISVPASCGISRTGAKSVRSVSIKTVWVGMWSWMYSMSSSRIIEASGTRYGLTVDILLHHLLYHHYHLVVVVFLFLFFFHVKNRKLKNLFGLLLSLFFYSDLWIIYYIYRHVP